MDAGRAHPSTWRYVAWNVVVPAAIGSVPIVVLMLIDPPPYATFDRAGMLMLVLLPVCGLVAGLLGRHPATAYLDVAISFWIAQSLAMWFSTCTNQYSGASCGPGGGVLDGLGGLAFAAGLAGLLGVLPLTVVFKFAKRAYRA